ncbi:MAG: sulfite exporter TauE/SafE family protein [Magnetococcales bacterium]|nr:sulfite exporter TauE/SafE family protein [Magnetococcales bacterium]
MVEVATAGVATAAPSLLSIWLLGISVGLTACAATCLPFLGTWSLGRGGGARGALLDTSFFLSGKVVAYGVLGALAGALGEWLSRSLESTLGLWAVGLAGVAAGVWLLLPVPEKSACGVSVKKVAAPPFILGFAMSLIPCAPLASLLALAAMGSDPLLGMGYGVVFGLGASLTPLLVVMPMVGSLGKLLVTDRPWLSVWLRRGAGLVLLALGLGRLIRAW